ncbi:universal stress protein [Streptomyces tirandamycinicus]|uniref:universal stress protein n=1 Tax=Streptomyces tirandamycinicus TaxID=2174846 RepID=UPI002270CE12|nr:universal stress protein [Streptomyces tirandamycinicus]MCY0982737.1 universal stress protein [Streptomyces tirandamycinicus]
MPQHVTAGLDGSAESAAAAEWAAREARLRQVALRLLLVSDGPAPTRAATETGTAGAGRDPAAEFLAGTADALRGRHPGLEVRARRLTGRPPAVLAREAAQADLVVLGSRGLGSVRGFLLGSVALATIVRTDRPVVLVRPQRRPGPAVPGEEAGAAAGSVVVGVDVHQTCDATLDFAFGEAALRGGRLRAVHCWSLPPFGRDAPALEMALREMRPDIARELRNVLAPWRQKYPSVEVTELTPVGGVSDRLLQSAAGAALVVVGRRIRTARAGSRLGPVAHAVIHHCASPVAVVAHD